MNGWHHSGTVIYKQATGDAGPQFNVKFAIQTNTFVNMLTKGTGKNFLKEPILIISWTCSETRAWKVMVDIQISWSTGCFASVSWWTATGRWTWVAAWQPVVERSIMSWQEGEGSDVLACPDRPAPVSLMRLPVTGDVVVRMCVSVYVCGCGFRTSASLAWLPLPKCLFYLACFQQPRAPFFLYVFSGKFSIYISYSCERFCVLLQLSDICTASVPHASKSTTRNFPRVVRQSHLCECSKKTLCINNSVTSLSEMSFSPPVCLPVSQTLSPLPLKPPTHLPFPMWGY